VAGDGLDSGKEYDWILAVKNLYLSQLSYDFLDDVEMMLFVR